MSFCPNCGTEVSEDTRFCPECGRPFMIVGQAGNGRNKKKIAGIIIACIIALIVIIVLFSIKPWERTYTLSVSVNPSQAGFVLPSGGEYKSGDQVTLTAIPNTGYTFDHWSGTTSATTSTVSITMDSYESLIAHFETIPTTPEVLFSDDFSDESSGWVTSDDADGRVAYVNECFYIKDYTYPEAANYGNCQRYFTDFVLEVETWLVGGTDNNWHSVICRLQDIDNYYDFGISADGYYDILKFDNENRISLVPPTYTSYINQGVDAVNIIYIECIGNTLSLSVNGHELANVTDNTFSGGDIALAATAIDGTFTEVAFDNIVVSDVNVNSDIVNELETANREAENVKTAALAYYADNAVWPTSSASLGLYLSGTLGASYSFDDDGFIDGVGDPGGFGGGTTSYMYPGCHWENPTSGVGHGHWVVDY